MGTYELTWRPLLGGALAIGHRPGRALRASLEASGCTHVLSLLSAKESDDPASDTRLRLPLETANPPGAHRDAEVLACFARLRALLATGAKVYVHCSAGLHRTGMITHAFLRHVGLSREQSLALIRELRAATADGVGETRLAWGDRFAERDAERGA